MGMVISNTLYSKYKCDENFTYKYLGSKYNNQRLGNKSVYNRPTDNVCKPLFLALFFVLFTSRCPIS